MDGGFVSILAPSVHSWGVVTIINKPMASSDCEFPRSSSVSSFPRAETIAEVTQNAPYEQKAVALKVFPRASSLASCQRGWRRTFGSSRTYHIPTRIWTIPPYPNDEAMTTSDARLSLLKQTLTTLEVNEVSAKAHKPTGAGLAKTRELKRRLIGASSELALVMSGLVVFVVVVVMLGRGQPPPGGVAADGALSRVWSSPNCLELTSTPRPLLAFPDALASADSLSKLGLSVVARDMALALGSR